jgi:hypothetical protein
MQALMDAQTVSMRNGQRPEYQEQMQRLMDRVVLLESLVNWRLYGLPGKAGSVTYEIAATLGHSIAIEKELQRLVEWGWHQGDMESLEQGIGLLPNQANICVLLSPELSGRVDELREKYREKTFTFVADPADILSLSYEKSLAHDSTILQTSLFLAISAFPDHHFDMIWMSDAILQTDGLKALVLLNRVRQALGPEAIIGMRIYSNVRQLVAGCLHDPTKLLLFWSHIEVAATEKYVTFKTSEGKLTR